MIKLIAGTVVLVLLVVSEYVASEPAEVIDEGVAVTTVSSTDPHVSYYEQHLVAMGIARPVR